MERVNFWIRAFWLAVTALAVLPAGAAETRLYFDRTTSEFVRVEEEAGAILSYKTLDPVSERRRFRMGDRQPAEVRSLGGGMTLIIRDVRGRGAAVNALGFEHRDDDWTWARVYRKSSNSDGYDAPYAAYDFGFPKRQDVESLFSGPDKLPAGDTVFDALIAVPSEDAMRAALLAVSDPRAAFPLIEECRAHGFEDDLFLAAIEFEAAAFANDGARVEKLLSTLSTRFRSSGNVVYAAMPAFYEDWVRGHTADKHGKNFHRLWLELAELAGTGNRDSIRQALRSAPGDGVAFAPRATALLNRYDVESPKQFNGLWPQVRAAMLSDLSQGHMTACREMLAGYTRMASVLSHRSTDGLTNLMATSFRLYAALMWRWLLLDSTLPAEQLAAAQRELAALVTFDREGLMNPAPPPETVHGGRNPDTSYLVDFSARHRVAHTELALVHAAAMVCIQRQETGSLPESPRQFYDLLGELGDDPWTDWEDPLLYRLESDRAVIYSRGPNRRDDGGTVQYDSDNGTFSGGDQIEVVLLQPPMGFPLPLDERFTPEAIQRHLPAGIHRYRNRGWTIGCLNAVPSSVFCTGPYGWQPGQGTKLDGPLPDGHAAIDFEGEWHDFGPAPAVVEYDPTNGTFSEGVIFLARDGRPEP